MYKISKINSEYDNPKFVYLKSGYWYYNYNITNKEVDGKTIYTFSQLRIKGLPNLQKCREAVLGAFKDEQGNNLQDLFLTEGANDQINDIIYNIKVDLGLEEGKTPLEKAKEEKIREINKYDTSDNVNSFLLNGVQVWLNKDTRVGLMNSLNIEKSSGKEISVLWFGTIKLEINIDAAIQMLGAIELYALECYNKTAEHKQNVEKLTSVEAVKKYDFTIGYPDKLNLTV